MMIMNTHKNIKNQKGFTLVELMVVIAILGILAAIAVPKLTSANESARGARIVADLRTIDTAIEMAIANGDYTPAAVGAIPAAVSNYLAGVPVPPQGHYITTSTGSTGANNSTASYGITANGRAVLNGSTATDLTTPPTT